MKIFRRGVLLLLIGLLIGLTIREIRKEGTVKLDIKQAKAKLMSTGNWQELTESSVQKLLRELSKENPEILSDKPADVDGCYMYMEYLMDARELVVLQSENEEWLGICQAAMKKRIDRQAELFADYEPVQSALMKNAVNETNQGVWYFFVGEDAPSAQKLMKELLNQAKER